MTDITCHIKDCVYITNVISVLLMLLSLAVKVIAKPKPLLKI